MLQFALDKLDTRTRYAKDGYMVYPNSLLFRAGIYKDKGVTVTNNDLRQLVHGTKCPHCFNLEHAYTGAHGVTKKACTVGHVQQAWIDPADPAVARGEVWIPLPVDSVIEFPGISVEVPPSFEAFTGFALTYTPRVPDAALMSAIATFASQQAKTDCGCPESTALPSPVSTGEILEEKPMDDATFGEKAQAWFAKNFPALAKPAAAETPAPIVPPLPDPRDAEITALKATIATFAATQTDAQKQAESAAAEAKRIADEATAKFAADNDRVIEDLKKANKLTPAKALHFTDGADGKPVTAAKLRAENPVLFDAMMALIPADKTFSGSAGYGQLSADELAAKLDADPKTAKFTDLVTANMNALSSSDVYGA